jgi:hypothetical protein
MNLLRKVCLFTAALIIIPACDDGKPDDLIEKDVYIDLLVEFELLRTIQRIDGDSLHTVQLTRTVLEEYGITYEQFERSYHYYMEDPEDHRQMYREAIDRLNQEVGRLRNPDKRSDVQNTE